jgi:hypothetical protein
MSAPPHTCWALADAWRSGYVILCANAEAIPAPPSQSPPIIDSEGLWGAHEWTIHPQLYQQQFPYLSWISLHPSNTVPSDFDVYTPTVKKTMWHPHPTKLNLHVINPTVLCALTTEWESIKSTTEDLFQKHIMSSVQPPKEAFFRALSALDRLREDFEAWRDFVQVFRSLQRSLLELKAFIDWYKDINAGAGFCSPVRTPTRGAIFEDVQAYINHQHWSIAAFLLIPKSAFDLDSSREASLLSHKLCQTNTTSHHSIPHTLSHWYYPPHVSNYVSDFETAARGYADRLDVFNPNQSLKRKLEKMENKKKDEGKQPHLLFLRCKVMTCENSWSQSKNSQDHYGHPD